MNETNDFALKTLMAAAREHGADLPSGAIEKIYALQKRHQFDADRVASLQEMQRLIESLVGASEGGAQ
jgi:hypothetical protein